MACGVMDYLLHLVLSELGVLSSGLRLYKAKRIGKDHKEHTLSRPYINEFEHEI